MQDQVIASHTCFGDTWMLTVKLVYKLLNVPDDLKWATNTHMTPFTHFQGIANNIYDFGRPFFSLLLNYFTRPPPVHPYFYPSILVITRPNYGWTDLYIKLCIYVYTNSNS